MVRVSLTDQENVEDRWELVLLDELEPDAADFDRTDLSAAITRADSSLRANVPSSLKWMPSG